MRSLVVWVWVGAAAVAAADVVHLTSGRSVRGDVISETETEVVVRVAGSGRLTFPRKLVREIERESPGATRLSLARQRSREGAWDEALRLYRAAAGDPDPAVAEAAARELAELERARAEAARRAAPKPRPPADAPPATPERAPAGGALQTPWARGLAALNGGRPAEARELFRALLEGSPSDPRYAFLYARALELTGELREAGARYRALIGPLGARRDLTPAWLGEIARRKLGGEALDADSPGIAAAWSRVEAGDAFVIYHPFPKIEPWLREEPEQALAHVLERLTFARADLAWSGRVQILLFENKRAYEEAAGMELAGGHAQHYAAPDGRLIQIRAYPLRSFYQTTFPHEIAHAVLYALTPDLPAWAHEGAAQYVESPRSRARARGSMRGARATESLPSLRELFAGAVARGATQAEVAAYYGLTLVTFEALVELCADPKDALQLCREIRALGADRALAKRSLSWERLEAAVEAAAQNTAAGD